VAAARPRRSPARAARAALRGCGKQRAQRTHSPHRRWIWAAARTRAHAFPPSAFAWGALARRPRLAPATRPSPAAWHTVARDTRTAVLSPVPHSLLHLPSPPVPPQKAPLPASFPIPFFLKPPTRTPSPVPCLPLTEHTAAHTSARCLLLPRASLTGACTQPRTRQPISRAEGATRNTFARQRPFPPSPSAPHG
jgi:hypothetical protein